MATTTNKDIRIAERAKKYRVKEIIDSDGDSSYYVQRNYFGIWLYVYNCGKYADTPWIFEVLFGSPKEFYNLKDAKSWIERRVNKRDVNYYYYSV